MQNTGSGMPGGIVARKKDTDMGDQFGRGVIAQIHAKIDSMPEALARIGRYVIANPDRVVSASIGELSAATGSGDASIFRFCDSLGFRGFRKFKLALASDIAYTNSTNVLKTDITDDDARVLVNRIVSSLSKTLTDINKNDIGTLASKLIAARSIDIFGSGLSGHVAGIFAFRFSQAGLMARAFQDPVAAIEVLPTIGKDTVVIAISETGLTVYNEELLRRANKVGAYTVAISGRAMKLLLEMTDMVLVAAPLSPPPARGEVPPALAKIMLCELIGREIEAQLGGARNGKASV